MKTPTQEQFQTVIDNFEKVLEKYPMAHVEMEETEVNYCGSPMCHAGWYVIAKGCENCDYDYQKGADLIAEDLGFLSNYSLKVWACRNPKIWGNHEGYAMFGSSDAFGKEEISSLSEIIDHWRVVKERAYKP